MTPLEAFGQAVVGALVSSAEHEPGRVVQQMGAEAREALSRLTSAEVASLRPDLLVGNGKRRGRFNR